MTAQLSMLDIMTPPQPLKRSLYRFAHMECECGLLWWDNHRGEAPSLQPFRHWKCWQGFRRVMAFEFDPFRKVPA